MSSFVQSLRDVIYDNFPYGPLYNKNGISKKHPNRTKHVRDAAFKDLPVVHELDRMIFDIGSPLTEENYPHYHILEDSEVIHIRNKGTTKSKGSQDKISDKKARDYGRVKWNGKTYSKEYARNVRGSRSRLGNARQTYVDSNGVVYRINETANTYANIHYHYIERILDQTLTFIAQEFGLKMMRKQDGGLDEEAFMQENVDSGNDFATNIINAMESFMGE